MSTTPMPHASPIETTIPTMRTLVGVDDSDYCLPILSLVGRLRFAGNRAILAHVEAPVFPVAGQAPIAYDYRSTAELEDRLRLRGKGILDAAEIAAQHAGFGEVERVQRFGSSSTALMEIADEQRSDLIAIGSVGRGPLASAFLGSVGRALAIGSDRTFLVARGKPGAGPVNAVFATDGSDYAVRCFRRLLDMAPEGIGKLTVVTATDPAFEEKVAREMGAETPEPYALSAAESRIRESAEGLAARWRAQGGTAEVRLVEGHPAEGLRRAMEETGSELLILGAKGHGLLERVLIGSVALHMVVAEAFSVMVIRLPEAA